jgi:hypothetical protein
MLLTIATELDLLYLADQLPSMSTLLELVVRVIERPREMIVNLSQTIAFSLFDKLLRYVVAILIEQQLLIQSRALALRINEVAAQLLKLLCWHRDDRSFNHS